MLVYNDLNLKTVKVEVSKKTANSVLLNVFDAGVVSGRDIWSW